MSASHDGLDFQAGLVRRMLTDIGLSEQRPTRAVTPSSRRYTVPGTHGSR